MSNVNSENYILVGIFFYIESIESYKEKIPKISPRLHVVTELLQTEKNYVGILHTVINVSLTLMYFFVNKIKMTGMTKNDGITMKVIYVLE